MKFRSLLYIVIAFAALALQILFAKKWGGIGCAIAVSSALIVGQGFIMNIYYSKKQGLDILTFWKEIGKMSIVPLVVSILALIVLKHVTINSWLILLASVICFSLIYLPSFWFFSMNQYERDLITSPIYKLIKRN
jgi:hypothetical protein